ncbi:MAG: hypothetical protein BroJett014_03890 [Planctomycetota bacterium]|nr:hypothetical protein [Planctomycetota bacterium]GIK51416.1 MAG: hypothetical protein BroJett014_03890 [Planctomycetota bacterium]
MPQTNVNAFANTGLLKSIQLPPTIQHVLVPAPVKIITDFTMSMDPIIEQVRKNISVAVDECKSMGVDLQPAFLVSRDLFDHGADGLRDDGFMTVDEFKHKLVGERTIGGTTHPESQLDAILVAIRGPWPNMKPRQLKNIVLTTNSDTHPNTQDGMNVDDVLKLALKTGCRVHIIGPDFPAYLKLTRETGGMFFNIEKNTDAESYKRIFAKLGKTITQTALGC